MPDQETSVRAGQVRRLFRRLESLVIDKATGTTSILVRKADGSVDEIPLNGPGAGVGPQGPQGPMGLQGPTGVPGAKGADGAMGPAGPQGPTGATGPTGIQGPPGLKGNDGAAGPTGPTGPAGPAGPQGPTGVQGIKGDTGVAGPAGADSTVPGPVGPTGPQGPAGADSTVPGPTGATGLQGPIGPAGPKGDTGATGSAGVAGPQGPQGATGPQGLAGSTGATGPQGPTGATGPAGPQGAGNTHGTLANRPAATGSNNIYFATDDGGIGTAWLDTAVGVWTPLAPGEIAYAENNSGTSQAWTAGTLDITGCTITVPACSRPVYLRAAVGIQQGAAGTGIVTVQINETTGATTLVGEGIVQLPGVTANGYQLGRAEIRLGATATQRTFKLSVGLIVFTLTPTFTVLNGNTSNAFRSVLLAEAR